MTFFSPLCGAMCAPCAFVHSSPLFGLYFYYFTAACVCAGVMWECAQRVAIVTARSIAASSSVCSWFCSHSSSTNSDNNWEYHDRASASYSQKKKPLKCFIFIFMNPKLNSNNDKWSFRILFNTYTQSFWSGFFVRCTVCMWRCCGGDGCLPGAAGSLATDTNTHTHTT